MGSQRRLRIQHPTPFFQVPVLEFVVVVLWQSCTIPNGYLFIDAWCSIAQSWSMHAPPLHQLWRGYRVRTWVFLPFRSNMSSVSTDWPQRRLTGTALRPCTLVFLSLRLPRDHSHTLSHYSHTLYNWRYFFSLPIYYVLDMSLISTVTHSPPQRTPQETLPLHENTPPPSAARTLLYY